MLKIPMLVCGPLLLALSMAGCDEKADKPEPTAASAKEKEDTTASSSTKRRGRDRPARDEGKRNKRKGKDKQKRGPHINPDAKADDGSTYTIGLRFHLLKSDDAEIVNTTIGRAGAQKLVDDVNAAWKQANIRFELESVVEVQAVDPNAYQALADDWKKTKKAERKKLKRKKGKLMRATIPKGNRIEKGIDIYMHRYMLGLGGVWGCPHRSIVYGERKAGKRKQMASGTILAHEIGHGLGLPHVPCKKGGNMMTEPCEHRKPDAFDLTEDQIAAARSWASTGAPRVCRKGEVDTED